jgi:hypothetical protein
VDIARLIRTQIESQLAPVFYRQDVKNLDPPLIAAKTLANLDSLGAGPPSFKIGKRVAYQRDPFIPWFIARFIK